VTKKLEAEKRLKKLTDDLRARYYLDFIIESKDLPSNYRQIIGGLMGPGKPFYNALCRDLDNLQNNGAFDEARVDKELQKNAAFYPILTKMLTFGEQKGMARALLIKILIVRNLPELTTDAGGFSANDFLDLDLGFEYEDLKSFSEAFSKTKLC
jgi:hypothetical protein